MTQAIVAKTDARTGLTKWAGCFPNLPEKEYYRRQIGIATKSGLDQIASSPAHYRAWCEEGEAEEDTPALAFGKAFHCRVLEPSVFAQKYIVEPEFGPLRADEAKGITPEQGKTNKLARAAWRKSKGFDADGNPPDSLVLVSQASLDRIEGMAARLEKHAYIGKILASPHGMREVTFRWVDKETGIYCQSRVDFYTPEFGGIALDLKTLEDAGRSAFESSCARYGYHRQDRMYRRGILAQGLPFAAFGFAAVEKTGRHEPALYAITDSESLEDGEATIARDLARLAKAVEEDAWPGYPENIIPVALPKWRDRVAQ